MKKAPGDVMILHLCTKYHDYGLFFALWPSQKHKKSKFWKNEKNWKCYHFQLVYHKWRSYDVWFLRYLHFLSFWTISCPLTLPPPIPLQLRKSKFWKNEKNAWRSHHFTKMYGKWQSYHVWFLIYEAQQTEYFLSFWATCWPFTPLTNYKIKWKKNA